jgi:hypothetical protein
LPTAGIALAAPFLVWFAIGDYYGGPVYRFGPYDVGPDSGYVVGGLAAIIALASVTVLVIRTRRGVADLLSWPIAVVLASAGALGAAGWRVCTASYSGADIGGPVVMLFDPLLIAGLLVGAVWIADAGGRARRRRTWLLTVAAALVAPALYGVMYVLSMV